MSKNTEIHLHNTLSGKKELFTPLRKGAVSMYHCGPTVYDTVHIGNLRSFLLGDILRRVFEFNSYNVTQVMNITDIDDKTIRRSIAEEMTLKDLTRKYEEQFLADIKAMNIQLPHKMPRATGNIENIIKLIVILLERGVAYKSRDGVYMSIGMVKNYGALAHINLKGETHERIENDEYEKENPRDFALWKFHSDADGANSWDASFGKGRPGWHIECSAMAMDTLGETIDIHTGGTDLIFPHHTNEIAQSESATGKQFVNYWLHGAFMNVEDAKMSKSKGNFLKLADLLHENVSPLAFRYWLMTAHYRTQVNFTWEALKAAQTALFRLIEHYIELGDEAGKVNAEYLDRFTANANDDLDMPKAVSLVWELLKDAAVPAGDKRVTLLEFDRILGLNLKNVSSSVAKVEIPPEVTALAEAREEARKNKEWDKADALRKEIEERGYSIKDTEKGFEVREG